MDEETRKRIAIESQIIAKAIGQFLRQEYKWHEKAWWLFTLDKPARPLTESEVQDAINRGAIPIQIGRTYRCPKCKYFDEGDPVARYDFEGQDYDLEWRETHRCPECGCFYEYINGNS